MTQDDFLPNFRPVPKTGVIYVMSEASKRGFRYGQKEWVNLGQGAPECGDIQGAPERLTSIEVDEFCSEYSPVAGIWELRESVANLYNARYRIGMPSQYSAENVAISAGGRAGLTRIAAAIGNINLGHFLPDYTAYEELLGIFRNFMAIPIVLDPQEGFQITSARVKQEIIGKGLSALLFSNPSNPTGHVIYGEELAKMLGYGKKYRCSLILDEFYSHYIFGDAQKSHCSVSAAEYIEDVDKESVVIVDGLTKNWRYPGLRLSWTLGPKNIISSISSAGSFLDGGANHPFQLAAIPLLNKETADKEAKTIQSIFSKKRTLMTETIRDLGLHLPQIPEGSFYCFPSLKDLPEELRNGMDFFHKTLDKKVITVPGRFFDVDPGHRRQHIPSRLRHFTRLSFGPSLSEIETGLERITNLIKGSPTT